MTTTYEKEKTSLLDAFHRIQQSNAQLEQIMQHSPTPVLITDHTGGIVKPNRAFLEMIGRPEHEVIGKKTFEFIVMEPGSYESVTGETIAIDNDFIQKVHENNALFNREGRMSDWPLYHINRENKIIPTVVHTVYSTNEQGERTGAFGIIHNMTQQRKVELELITSKESAEQARRQIENLLENCQDPIIFTDQRGIITRPNKAFLDMLGYTEEEVIGQPAHSFTVMKEGTYETTAGETVTIDRAFLDQGMESVSRLRQERRIADWFIYLFNREQKIVPVLSNTIYSTGENGEITGSFGILRNITQQRKAELELIKAKELAEHARREIESLIEIFSDPIIFTDAHGAITKPNRAFLDMVGYSEEEVRGKFFYSFTVVEEKIFESTAGEQVTVDGVFLENSLEKIALLRREGKIDDLMGYIINKEGKGIPIIANIMYLKNENGEPTGAFGIIRNITEQRKAEQALINAREAAETANIAKGQFLANMSHEIRTPMNGIIGFLDMLMHTKLDDEQIDYARTIKISSESLLSLINDILDFSKIEAGKISIAEMDFDIEVLVHDVCELIRPRVEKGRVEVFCRVSDKLPARVKSDPHRIRQVLVNLLGNAAKFTHSGEIELSIDVEEEREDGLKIHARVRDTGIGIAPNKLETIFELFQQADYTTTRKYGGTGLGLSISRKTAECMGGSVWAESPATGAASADPSASTDQCAPCPEAALPPKGGMGSIFHFTAWVKRAESKPVKKFLPVSLKGKNVFVVDDNKTNIDILSHIIETAGMNVVGYTNGEDALQAVQERSGGNNQFDIGILDIVMPDMSGYALAKKLRDLTGDRCLLIALSSSTDDDMEKCRKAGFNGFFPKPVHRVKLVKMMERLLGEAAAVEQLPQKHTGMVTQHSIREDHKHTISILLAEDNPVNQKLALTMLSKAGYTVEVAGNGSEAVEIYSSAPQKYDIILMDIQMPRLNGHDATRILREKGFKHVPIIAMTANAMKGDREKCLESGMNDYIAKPINREVVFEMLDKWVFERPFLKDQDVVAW